MSRFKLESIKLQTEKIYRVPLSIQDTIPVYRISKDGIFELERKKGNHLFDKLYLFEDVNFSTLDEEEKEDTARKYEMLLRSMNVSYKLIVSSNYADGEDLQKAIATRAVSEEMEPIAKHYHELFQARLETGRSGLAQARYFAVTCRKKSMEDARSYFSTIDFSIQQLFLK